MSPARVAVVVCAVLLLGCNTERTLSPERPDSVRYHLDLLNRGPDTLVELDWWELTYRATSDTGHVEDWAVMFTAWPEPEQSVCYGSQSTSLTDSLGRVQSSYRVGRPGKCAMIVEMLEQDAYGFGPDALDADTIWVTIKDNPDYP